MPADFPAMIPVREYILFPEWLGSDRVIGLRDHEKLFFIRLGHATDGAGRFEADAALLRAALYPKELHKVSERDVKGLLMRMHQVGLVRLYTRAGKGFGEVTLYKQRDARRKVRYPAPDEGELNFATTEAVPIPARPPDPPPSPLLRIKKGIEGKGKETFADALPPASVGVASMAESADVWLMRLRAEWPAIDVDAELQKAITKKARTGELLERGWFEMSWLKNCTQTITRGEVFRAAKAKQVEGEPVEPEGWRSIVVDTAYGPGGALEAKTWAGLPLDIKRWVIEQLGRTAA